MLAVSALARVFAGKRKNRIERARRPFGRYDDALRPAEEQPSKE